MDLDISKMLLEISNEKRKRKKENQTQTQSQLKIISHIGVSINFSISNDKSELSDYKDCNDSLVNFKCTECSGYQIKEIDGYYVCLKCGLKIESIIDSGQEWHNYNNDDSRGGDQARCDMPTNELLPKSSMGGIVGWGTRETFTTKRIRNMSRWYSTTYKESSLLEIFNNLTIIAMNSGLNQCIIEEAKYMFKRVSEVKSARRTKKDSMKAGAIALACKMKGYPRNSVEIAKICMLKNNKTLRRGIKGFEEIWNNIVLKEKQAVKALAKSNKLQYKLDNNDLDDNTSGTDTSNSNADANDIEDDLNSLNDSENNVPKHYSNNNDNDAELKQHSDNIVNYTSKLHRFMCILNIDNRVLQAGKKILEHVETNNYLDKHNPQSKVAAVLFYIIERLNINIKKHQIIQICQVSQVTINKCYQKLIKYKAVLNMIDIS